MRKPTASTKRSAAKIDELNNDAVLRLINLAHSDPHSILGAHHSSKGIVVRAWCPDALKVSLLVEGKRARSMKQKHVAGLFETNVIGVKDFFAYKFEVEYAEKFVRTIRDPYSYLPTLGDLDLHLFNEGRHELIYHKLGSHVHRYGEISGVSFAVWAPNALGVSVVADFNGWDGRIHPMRLMGSSGVWELFIPDLEVGHHYKYEIRTALGPILKADPHANSMQHPPQTASIIYASEYIFSDEDWMARRGGQDLLKQPISIYEVHAGSWKRKTEENQKPLSYRELAHELGQYVSTMGFSHIELMPINEHPYGGSWGYQVSSYFAPTARYGTPDDFRYFVDHMHKLGIGVILDWVPAHFPKDAFALGRFDGTALYEHIYPQLGEHPDWGTYIFNYGRNEVRNFLLASALYWLNEFHIDGLRLDAVASMLYLDYSRNAGEWMANKFGGRENLDAISLLRELNKLVHAMHPGVLMIAEESTAWPGVSRPTYTGGLGFSYKWNMGWMHDTLTYFTKDSIYRRFHHNNLTFGLLYAWSENFILPLSHDEVVHGKGSMIGKMTGDRWRKFANLRSLYGYMWAHPGKKLLFMGGELAQWSEWNVSASLDWHFLDYPEHSGIQLLVRDLNNLYRNHPALWEADSEPAGFEWIDANNSDYNIIAFIRKAPVNNQEVVVVCNFSPVPQYNYRLGLPHGGKYTELLNTDSIIFGGSNLGNVGEISAEEIVWNNMPYSAQIIVPPLATLWFKHPPNTAVGN